MSDWFSTDTILQLTKDYRAFGPLIGFLLPFIEAFLPFLPIVAFVIANAAAYGLWFGFILSWGGTVVGSYTVFLLIRKYGRNRFLKFMTRHERVQKLINWVDRNGFGPLFVLICFPFTPSALVNIVAGLSNMKKKNYLFTLMAGKLVMIFSISFIGYDIKALITQPVRSIIVIVVIIVLWLVGKQVELRLNKKVDEESSQVEHQTNNEMEQNLVEQQSNGEEDSSVDKLRLNETVDPDSNQIEHKLNNNVDEDSNQGEHGKMDKDSKKDYQ